MRCYFEPEGEISWVWWEISYPTGPTGRAIVLARNDSETKKIASSGIRPPRNDGFVVRLFRRVAPSLRPFDCVVLSLRPRGAVSKLRDRCFDRVGLSLRQAQGPLLRPRRAFRYAFGYSMTGGGGRCSINTVSGKGGCLRSRSRRRVCRPISPAPEV